ncbi:hypothetical protein EXIGLDRAFT_770191 [Exidia glandulosa HHB12029]|uniref:Uncharacterized protein n=1 Tax=Exidia glandulosa HHB12029 TaxID=1314781 RepID=A0A165GXA6_EXIGL|nr:hypothetical protein EXIGLDRAFT_770191 [Exidia glandulosa HHB12029]
MVFGRPTLEVDDDDELEVVIVPGGPKKLQRVESPVIKKIVRPRAGAADISTRLQRIEAAQTKLTTLVTASTEQLGKRIQKLEKSAGDAMKRLEPVEALLEKVLERLG